MTVTERWTPVDLSSYSALAELLDLHAERYAWRAYAACTAHPEVDFFPERGHSTREAKAICATCPVKDACLEVALANGEKFGIWGGMSERERRRIRRDRHQLGTREATTIEERIVDLLHRVGGTWNGDLDTLARRLDRAPNSVRQAIYVLQREGLVTTTKEGGGKGHGAPSITAVHLVTNHLVHPEQENQP